MLRENPEKARELIREKCKYRPDEKENAYLKSLRASLGCIIDELSSSIESDEFTPYWDRLSLTNESSYVSEMKDLLQEAARKMPFEALVPTGRRRPTKPCGNKPSSTGILTRRRVSGLCSEVSASETLEATPEKERTAVMETIEERFKEILPEDDLKYVMRPIREAAGADKTGTRSPLKRFSRGRRAVRRAGFGNEAAKKNAGGKRLYGSDRVFEPKLLKPKGPTRKTSLLQANTTKSLDISAKSDGQCADCEERKEIGVSLHLSAPVVSASTERYFLEAELLPSCASY